MLFSPPHSCLILWFPIEQLASNLAQLPASLFLHPWRLILSQFLSVSIKPSTNRLQGHFSHNLQAGAMCLHAASFYLRTSREAARSP